MRCQGDSVLLSRQVSQSPLGKVSIAKIRGMLRLDWCDKRFRLCAAPIRHGSVRLFYVLAKTMAFSATTPITLIRVDVNCS